MRLDLRSSLGWGLLMGAATAPAAGTQMELTTLASTVGHYYTNSSALTATGTVSSFGVNGSASATATIGMGEIHAQSQAFTPGPSSTAQSTITAEAYDEATAKSTTSSNVVVRWYLPVTGSGSQSGDGYAHADFGFFSQSVNSEVGVNYRFYVDSGAVAYDGYFGNSGNVNYVDVTYQVGQSYDMGITYDGDIRLDGLMGSANGILDYANTAHAYAQVLTPGATLSFASGHDYSLQPTPEPATLAALGMGAFGAIRRRRRS